MNLALYIARRYLVAKKSHNAINIISMISVISVVIATVALVCVLSVLNGFGDLVSSLFSSFDPELKITPAKGKVFDPNTALFRQVRALDEIDICTEVLQENVLVGYHGRQEVAVAKGVSDSFRQLASIDSVLFNGAFKLHDGDVYCTVLGIGLSTTLGVRTGFAEPLEIYLPDRDRQVNLANVASSFRLEYAFVAGEFMTNQAVYDESYMILPLDMLREMLNYETQVSALELKLKSPTHIKTVQKQIRAILGDDFMVKDSYEQQEAAYKMIQMEKWISFLILAFILMIAMFNIVSSVSMLMIEKQEDAAMLRSMGAEDRLIRRIFISEGIMISVCGALIGVVMGLFLCLIQQHFGLIKMGEMGAFVTDNYPVRINPLDIGVIFTTVCTIGFLTSWYPVRYLEKKWLHKSRLAIVLFPLLLFGCQHSPNNTQSIMVTIEPQRYFAEKIAGGLFEVYAVVPVGQSPESYDPAPHEMIRIAQSKAYLQIGGIGFEQAWLETIRTNNPQLKFYDLSDGIHLTNTEFKVQGSKFKEEASGNFPTVEGVGHERDLDMDHEADHATHSHSGIDPHTWSAPATAKIIARNTLRAFQEIDTAHQAAYQANYKLLIDEIDETARLLHAMLDTLTCRTFVIYHPALTYFAGEFGLRQLSIESDGKEPSVASLRDLIDEARRAHVRVVFVQQEFDSRHAALVSAEIGARTVVINPLDKQWKEQMLHIARELTK